MGPYLWFRGGVPDRRPGLDQQHIILICNLVFSKTVLLMLTCSAFPVGLHKMNSIGSRSAFDPTTALTLISSDPLSPANHGLSSVSLHRYSATTCGKSG